MLEKDIEKILVKEVKKLGGLCYKWVSPPYPCGMICRGK